MPICEQSQFTNERWSVTSTNSGDCLVSQEDSSMYCKIKLSTSLCYFDTGFMYNIGRVSDRKLHDSLYMHYIDKKSWIRSSSMRNYSNIVHKTCVKMIVRRTFWSYSASGLRRNVYLFFIFIHFNLKSYTFLANYLPSNTIYLKLVN